MNHGLIAILDNDSDYANSLADYFRLKGGISSEIVVFTREDSFEEYAKNHSFDILLINQEFTNILNRNCSDTINQFNRSCSTTTTDKKMESNVLSQSHNIFTLCEHKTMREENTGICLFKYTSAEELLRQIMANYKPVISGVTIPFVDKQKSKIIGVYSPVNRCGKTSFTLALAMQFSLNKSCIFLSFDCFSSLDNIAYNDCTNSKTIDDLLYYFAQSNDNFDSKLLSTVKRIQHLDFIPPSYQSCVIDEMSSSERILFLQKLIDTNRYEYIFIDIGNVSPVYPILQLCQKIYIPTLENDAYSEQKVNQFITALTKMCSDNSISLEKISVPVTNYNSNSLEYICTLASGEIAQYVSSLNDTINI